MAWLASAGCFLVHKSRQVFVPPLLCIKDGELLRRFRDHEKSGILEL
jgi:hypothetical protein